METPECHSISSNAGPAMSRRGISLGAVGLGDAIKALTKIFGIRPCAACEKRAAKLNTLSLARFMGGKQ